jgi:hypothetical protein
MKIYYVQLPNLNCFLNRFTLHALLSYTESTKRYICENIDLESLGILEPQNNGSWKGIRARACIYI